MRQSGILMHITSLPGPYGVGTMGERPTNSWTFSKVPVNPAGRFFP